MHNALQNDWRNPAKYKTNPYRKTMFSLSMLTGLGSFRGWPKGCASQTLVSFGEAGVAKVLLGLAGNGL